MKRIKVIVPIPTDMRNETLAQLYEQNKGANTEVVVGNIPKGSKSLECTYDEIWSAFYTVREAEAAQAGGYDGVIIYAFSDVGLRAAKEILTIPIVGLGEVSMHLASLLGSRFSIISAGPGDRFPSQRRRVHDQLKMYGLEHKCASVRSISIPVLDVTRNKEEEKNRLFTEVKGAIEQDGADTVVIGCGLILGVEKAVSEELRIPIVVPGIAALKVCELLIDMGLKQSKLCFAPPPEKERNF